MHDLTVGHTVVGILKGYDQLLNLVLDGTVEYLQGIIMYVNTILLL